MISGRLADPGLGPSESGFLAEIEDAFTSLVEPVEQSIYLDGASRLLSEEHSPDLPEAEALMHTLERRVNLLRTLRSALEELAERNGLRFVAPPLPLCTDNAAMIAWAGIERLALGQSDPLDFAARPRWPLDPDAAPVRGAGVKA